MARKKLKLSATTDEDELFEIDGEVVTEEEVDAAREVGEKLLEIGRSVTMGRVIGASSVVLLLLFTIFAGWYWVIPRDAVDVETYYFHGGGGQVVLVQIHNVGSREVTDVTVEIEFSRLDGTLVDSTTWSGASIPAHMSLAGDDLEMLMQGESVWQEYNIDVWIQWTDGNGVTHTQEFSYLVGSYISDWHVDSAPRSWWLF